MNEELLQEVKKEKNLKENESFNEQNDQTKSAIIKREPEENNMENTKYMKDDDDLRYII